MNKSFVPDFIGVSNCSTVEKTEIGFGLQNSGFIFLMAALKSKDVSCIERESQEEQLGVFEKPKQG